MQISFYPKYTPSFTSKKVEIRKADDIQRKTRTAFPFFSPKYADDYYKSCSSFYKPKSSSDCIRHWDNVHILDKKASKLSYVRENRHEELCGRNTFANKVAQTISDIQRSGLANCEEASTLTMASLIANGFPNTLKCSLKLDTMVVDKKTGEIKHTEKDSLDHAFVISTLDKDPNNQDTFYVIDSWFGFADSISGAKAKYKQYIDGSRFTKAKQKTLNNFKNRFRTKIDPSLIINNYEIRQSISYDPKEGSSPKDDADIIKRFKEKYPELILDNETQTPCK